jgi:hypothetical protein
MRPHLRQVCQLLLLHVVRVTQGKQGRVAHHLQRRLHLRTAWRSSVLVCCASLAKRLLCCTPRLRLVLARGNFACEAALSTSSPLPQARLSATKVEAHGRVAVAFNDICFPHLP